MEASILSGTAAQGRRERKLTAMKILKRALPIVLAVCLLANSVEDMKKNILSPSEWDELYHIMEFARKHDLALLCWGAHLPA